ncbi:MAG: hypothetical protein A2W91_20625 [Bacteroidetes bacterium GWF2_38_335]|nr:MAG: hypothetical protein A2W91_20625 [Bacteroidetes bacterium GWF2_38_335]OFY80763.1 MAG: hypothetical protein A2281_17060 [Bacteroidetes bacterium RIFOXYA12_FULL_38_20]
MFRQIGSLLIILGITMIVPALVSIIYSEYYSLMGFLISGLICLSTGSLLYYKINSKIEPLTRHALIIAALGWLFITIFGAIPFVLISYITPHEIMQGFVPNGADYQSSLIFFKNPLHALLESMSGFTTTGLSMAVHEPSIGKGLLFYRHFIQWLGGAGFVVLTISILKQPNGKISYLLYNAESTGERLRTTIIETARSIWKIYTFLTLFCFLFLIVGIYFLLPEYSLSDNIFDAINHAMAGMSTGGFSTLDNSIAEYQSQGAEILLLFPMILGALSLPFYVKFFNLKQYNQLWKDSQTKTIIIFFIFGSLILSYLLFISGSISEPFRVGTFQFVSALSTTGWQTSDVHTWDSGSVLFIVIGMIVGGSLGATVGGVKIIRVIILFKGLFWRIGSFFKSEDTVKVAKINNTRLLPEDMNREIATVSIFVFIYCVFLLLGTLGSYYFMDAGYTLKDALFESASAQGTVGLSCGITNPEMSPVLELIYIFQMWIGRLEIIPVLVLFRAILFGTKPFLT